MTYNIYVTRGLSIKFVHVVYCSELIRNDFLARCFQWFELWNSSDLCTRQLCCHVTALVKLILFVDIFALCGKDGNLWCVPLPRRPVLCTYLRWTAFLFGRRELAPLSLG